MKTKLLVLAAAACLLLPSCELTPEAYALSNTQSLARGARYTAGGQWVAAGQQPTTYFNYGRPDLYDASTRTQVMTNMANQSSSHRYRATNVPASASLKNYVPPGYMLSSVLGMPGRHWIRLDTNIRSQAALQNRANHHPQCPGCTGRY